MADRTVSVRLTLDNKGFLANLAAAEAAVKKFQNSFGKGSGQDPYEPFRTPPRDLPKRGEAAGGAFARGFSRRLDAAFRQLPKAVIDADSSESQRQVAELRQALADLSGKTIGVDVNTATALGELRALHGELERLAAESPEIDVRADAGAALTQIRELQKEVSKLGADDPTIRADADTAQAQAALGDLRRRLDELSTRRTAGVDLDAGAAHAELGSIQRDLQRLNTSSADVQVRADSAAALAQIRAMQAETSRLDGRTASVRVNADVAGALTAIAAVGAALAALPAVASIGLGVGALGAAFGAAGAGALAFGAVAGPSLGRVNEALKESESASGGAGGAMKSAGQKAAEAASSALRLAEAQDRVRDAAYGVRMAQRGVSDALRDVRDKQDALRQAQEAAGLAGARVSEIAEAGARRITDAERSAQDAHRATQRAVEDLTRARAAAQEKLEDLALATEGGALAEERAQISLKRARQNQARVSQPGSGASQTDKEDAELAVREAEFAVKRLKESNADLAQERAKADAQGVEGSDEVRSAKEALEAATRREADAERAVSEARTQAARDVSAAQRDAAQAARDVSRAQRDVRDSLRDVQDAQRKVTEAERDQLRSKQRLRLEQLQQKAALEQTGGAAGGAATKMSKLSDAEKELAKDVKKFTDAYEDWQRSLQPDVFPVIRKGMDLLTTGMKVGTPLVRASAGAFGQLIEKTNTGLQSQQWTRFFDMLTVMAPKAIDGLGTAAGNLAGGLAGIFEAFAPKADDLLTWVKGITQEFENWGQGLSTDSGFARFMAYAQENAPKVGELIGNLGRAIGNLLSGASDPGADLLDFLVSLSESLANLSPEQYEAIAKAIGLIIAAVKLGTTVKLGIFVALAEVLGKMSPGQIEAAALAIAGVVIAVKGYQSVSAAVGFWGSLSGKLTGLGDAAAGAKGKLAGFTKVAGGLAIGLVGLEGVGSIVNSLEGQSKGVDKLTLALTELGQTGKWAGDLSSQWTGGFHSADEAAAEFRKGLKELQDPSLYEMAIDHPFTELSAVLPGLDSSVDRLEQKFADMDTTLSGMVSSGNLAGANAAFERLKEEAGKAGVPVEKLEQLFPLYSQAVRVAGNASSEAAGGIDAAKQKLDGFQSSLDVFNGRTDAARVVREMESAYKDVKKAIEDANGKLDLNAQMTDKQRDATIRARDQFGGYLEKISAGALAQEKLSGRTGDATLAVARQLDKLFDLAGKSKEAREQVYQLAEKFGISREQADKATRGAKELRDMLAQLKDKQLKIELDTKAARDKAMAFAKELLGIKVTLPVGIAAPPAKPPKKAWGGISHADGREYMAMGGIRSAGSSPQAMVAKQPYMISGRSGPDVVFGEAGWEAYIPLDSSKRGRGLQVLGEAASAMGMAVVPQQVGAGSAPVWTSGGALSGASGAMVSVTGIDALKGSLDATSTALTGSLAEATSAVTSTLGEAGSVTSALGRMTETLDAQLTKLTSAVESLSGAVAGAGAAASAAQGKIGSAASAKAKSSTGKIGTAVSATASGKSKIGTAISATASKGKAKGVGSAGTSLATLAGIDGALAAAAKKVQINMISGSTASAPVQNSSKVSKPVQAAPKMVATTVAGGGGSTDYTRTGSGTSSGSGPLVAMYGTVMHENADVDRFAAQLSMRVDGRG